MSQFHHTQSTKCNTPKELLKKVFAKIAALLRLKRLVPFSTLLVLYRSFVLSHFEYCNSLLIGIGKTLNKKLEDANHYGLRTIMNLGRSINYESTLRIADTNTLEHRRIEQSLTIFYKCYKENGRPLRTPNYSLQPKKHWP